MIDRLKWKWKSLRCFATLDSSFHLFGCRNWIQSVDTVTAGDVMANQRLLCPYSWCPLPVPVTSFFFLSPRASDRARHPALPVRLVGHALPAAEAGGGRTFAPASRRPVLPGVRGLHLSVVRLSFPSLALSQLSRTKKHLACTSLIVFFFLFRTMSHWRLICSGETPAESWCPPSTKPQWTRQKCVLIPAGWASVNFPADQIEFIMKFFCCRCCCCEAKWLLWQEVWGNQLIPKTFIFEPSQLYSRALISFFKNIFLPAFTLISWSLNSANKVLFSPSAQLTVCDPSCTSPFNASCSGSDSCLIS